MRSVLVAALFVAGCKDTPKPAEVPPAPGSGHPPIAADASLPDVDWAACERAITDAGNAPLSARPRLVIDGCHVCGDWVPILNWRTPPDKGGPPRAAIQEAMERCSAFCVGMARDRFLGTLDDARATASRLPWKQLALVCKEGVSAVPDDRFVDGAYFALDRIARAIGAHGGDLATKAFALELPLSAASVTGTELPIPEVQGAVPQVAAVQITVLAGTITVGPLPRAHMSANGLAVALGSDAYPGKTVTLADLPSVLKGLVASDPGQKVAILAPASLKAELLVPVIAAASPVVPVSLGARATDSPVGWTIPGLLPVTLDVAHRNGGVKVTHEMTVQQLADELMKPRTSDRVGITGP